MRWASFGIPSAASAIANSRAVQPRCSRSSLKKLQKVTVPAARRHMLGRDAGNFVQQLIKFRAELIPTAGDFLNALKLSQGNGALQFGHLIIGREEKRITNFLLALVAFIQK